MKRKLFYILSNKASSFENIFNTIRRQIDVTTYQLLFFLFDTLLCLFGDELYKSNQCSCLRWNSYAYWTSHILTHQFHPFLNLIAANICNFSIINFTAMHKGRVHTNAQIYEYSGSSESEITWLGTAKLAASIFLFGFWKNTFLWNKLIS